MKAYELPVKLTSEGKFQIPDTLMKQLPSNQVIRVILLINEPTEMDEESEWTKLTSEQFLSGYSESDKIYDKL